MERRKDIYRVIFPPLVLFLFILNIQTVQATDELYLTGILKKVDPMQSLVTVEVQSESCPGIMTFRVAEILQLEGSEGKKISFFIDTSACTPNEIHLMYGITFRKGYHP